MGDRGAGPVRTRPRRSRTFVGRMGGVVALAARASALRRVRIRAGAWPLGGAVRRRSGGCRRWSRWRDQPAAARRRHGAAARPPTRASCARPRARTWRFFETFVGAEDNSLPPDNFQEDPQPVVAHRTSPTNIGLYLLSTRRRARLRLDRRCSTPSSASRRTLDTLDAAGALPRALLQLVRDPRRLGRSIRTYVSTVDSGNLAGHLLVLAQACRELPERPLLGPRGAAAGIARRARSGAARTPCDLPSDDRRTLTVTPHGRSTTRWTAVAARARQALPDVGASPGPRAWLDQLDDARRHAWPTSRGRCARSATIPRRTSCCAWAEAVRVSGREPRARPRHPRRPGRDVSIAQGSTPGRGGAGAAPSCRTLRGRSGRVRAHRASRSVTRAGSRGAGSTTSARRGGRVRRPHPPAGCDRPPARTSLFARDGLSTSSSIPTRKLLLDRLPRRATASSTPAATTCSPPRRGSRASSRSPRATCRRRTGSSSAAR